MTVAELIATLSKLPQDSLVVVRGYEGGVNSVVAVHQPTIILNYHTSDYMGSHELVENAYDDVNVPRIKVPAVHIIGAQTAPPWVEGSTNAV